MLLGKRGLQPLPHGAEGDRLFSLFSIGCEAKFRPRDQFRTEGASTERPLPRLAT